MCLTLVMGMKSIMLLCSRSISADCVQLCDQFVSGLRSVAAQKKLLGESDLSLKRALGSCGYTGTATA